MYIVCKNLWKFNVKITCYYMFSIWSQLQERVYCTRIRDVDHLVERLVEEWSRFDLEIVSAAVTQWRARLRARVKADGGHFEHFL